MLRWFGPRNSLILLYDHLTPESAEEMEAQIDEVRRYYRFVPFSQLVTPARSARKLGVAAVAFRHPRKSFFLRGLPALKEREIPVMIFVRPDWVGTNRLPLEDEWAAYPGNRADDIRAQLWNDPSGAKRRLAAHRVQQGPPPLNEMDPSFFFGTWGNLLEIPTHLREIGLHCDEPPSLEPHWSADLNFIAIQTKQKVTSALVPVDTGSAWSPPSSLGITAVLTDRVGVVEKKTSPLHLPHFRPEPTAP